MKVELISCTDNALDLLLFTKETRLEMDHRAMEAIADLTYVEKLERLEYMRNTIASSWEFVDYVFAISNVTRAFTHQLVRHRVGTSFAQQSQRTVNMSGFGYEGPASKDGDHSMYDTTMRDLNAVYKQLIKTGMKPEDARGILPTNIHTNIIFKANLRTLHDMGLKRLCVKTQGEFQRVFREIRQRVLEVHPWAKKFILPWCAFHGSCCFPTYPVEQCYVKPIVYNPENGLAYGSTGLAASTNAIIDKWEKGQ
jgi:flavin-dependent thymidylate synthase